MLFMLIPVMCRPTTWTWTSQCCGVAALTGSATSCLRRWLKNFSTSSIPRQLASSAMLDTRLTGGHFIKYAGTLCGTQHGGLAAMYASLGPLTADMPLSQSGVAEVGSGSSRDGSGSGTHSSTQTGQPAAAEGVWLAAADVAADVGVTLLAHADISAAAQPLQEQPSHVDANLAQPQLQRSQVESNLAQPLQQQQHHEQAASIRLKRAAIVLQRLAEEVGAEGGSEDVQHHSAVILENAALQIEKLRVQLPAERNSLALLPFLPRDDAPACMSKQRLKPFFEGGRNRGPPRPSVPLVEESPPRTAQPLAVKFYIPVAPKTSMLEEVGRQQTAAQARKTVHAAQAHAKQKRKQQQQIQQQHVAEEKSGSAANVFVTAVAATGGQSQPQLRARQTKADSPTPDRQISTITAVECNVKRRRVQSVRLQGYQ